ncbi:hypothetical protein L218DRAFT_12342 [Marasmius fiardii PR-910]|nr:hypothetical protein L218DRAFT_12342 [Marasmius fiardii PR-910]
MFFPVCHVLFCLTSRRLLIMAHCMDSLLISHTLQSLDLTTSVVLNQSLIRIIYSHIHVVYSFPSSVSCTRSFIDSFIGPIIPL